MRTLLTLLVLLLLASPAQAQTNAYVWGLYPDVGGGFKWWVSRDGLDLGADVRMCVISAAFVVKCYELTPHGYSDGRTWFHTGTFYECGTWSVQFAWWDGQLADIHQPNEYKVICGLLPFIKRG